MAIAGEFELQFCSTGSPDEGGRIRRRGRNDAYTPWKRTHSPLSGFRVKDPGTCRKAFPPVEDSHPDKEARTRGAARCSSQRSQPSPRRVDRGIAARPHWAGAESPWHFLSVLTKLARRPRKPKVYLSWDRWSFWRPLFQLSVGIGARGSYIVGSHAHLWHLSFPKLHSPMFATCAGITACAAAEAPLRRSLNPPERGEAGVMRGVGYSSTSSSLLIGVAGFCAPTAAETSSTARQFTAVLYPWFPELTGSATFPTGSGR